MNPEQLDELERLAKAMGTYPFGTLDLHAAMPKGVVLDLIAAARENAELRERIAALEKARNPLLKVDPKTGEITNLTDEKLREQLRLALSLLDGAADALSHRCSDRDRGDAIAEIGAFLREVGDG
jgi:hypothetical protein